MADALWEFIKKLPPKWRGPVALAAVLLAAVTYFVASDSYETQQAHAADITAVRAEMQDLPNKLVEALDKRDAAKRKRKR
jgi:hypothetical protein